MFVYQVSLSLLYHMLRKSDLLYRSIHNNIDIKSDIMVYGKLELILYSILTKFQICGLHLHGEKSEQYKILNLIGYYIIVQKVHIDVASTCNHNDYMHHLSKFHNIDQTHTKL